MKLQTNTLLGLTLSIMLAGSGLARAQATATYRDDARNLLDVETIEESYYSAPIFARR